MFFNLNPKIKLDHFISSPQFYAYLLISLVRITLWSWFKQVLTTYDYTEKNISLIIFLSLDYDIQYIYFKFKLTSKYCSRPAGWGIFKYIPPDISDACNKQFCSLLNMNIKCNKSADFIFCCFFFFFCFLLLWVLLLINDIQPAHRCYHGTAILEGDWLTCYQRNVPFSQFMIWVQLRLAAF